jgi:hypothetical protein
MNFTSLIGNQRNYYNEEYLNITQVWEIKDSQELLELEYLIEFIDKMIETRKDIKHILKRQKRIWISKSNNIITKVWGQPLI